MTARLLAAFALGLAPGLSGMAAAETSGGPAPPSGSPDPALVAEGEQWWTRSPDPGNPVACATCHHDPTLTRGWAAGFPKVRPLPPPRTRVMTLLQANAEAVARHYRVADPRAVATAITAYVTDLGAGLPISPGVSPGQPLFPERIRELTLSVKRGERLFRRHCHPCHQGSALAPSVNGFPRVRHGRAESLESFVEGHASPRGLAWHGQAMADLVGYLVSYLAGQPLGRRPDPRRKDTP